MQCVKVPKLSFCIIFQVLAYDKKIINDERVKLRVVASMEPHPMSAYGDNDFGYQTIKNSIRQIWTNATVVPGMGLHEHRTFVRIMKDLLSVLQMLNNLNQKFLNWYTKLY